ncbi:MAG: glycosyltransferase family 2 protein [Lachnospiraceae bacterium]|nr:glycosyltransferase family 2 protein [Lachnospiraceae bacterium]
MITAVSMVKNAADVIETMIRGNSIVADNYVIVDNASTDNTRQIIAGLQSEGFQIDVLSDENISPYQRDRVGEAIKYSLDKYDPDVILPLDDDEIICTDNDDIGAQGLREYIESLDPNNLYYMNCRHYIPTDEDDLSQVCVALRQKYCLADEPDMTRKVFIPAKVAQSDSFRIGWGSHFAQGDQIKDHVLLKDIRLSHYPIRSSVQIASKVIIGWTNYLVMPDREKNLSIHWRQMYQAIKRFGLPNNDMMLSLANMYREHPGDVDNLNVDLHPINIPDKYFELKYTTSNEINLLGNICENFERIADDYVNLLKKDQHISDGDK